MILAFSYVSSCPQCQGAENPGPDPSKITLTCGFCASLAKGDRPLLLSIPHRTSLLHTLNFSLNFFFSISLQTFRVVLSITEQKPLSIHIAQHVSVCCLTPSTDAGMAFSQPHALGPPVRLPVVTPSAAILPPPASSIPVKRPSKIALNPPQPETSLPISSSFSSFSSSAAAATPPSSALAAVAALTQLPAPQTDSGTSLLMSPAAAAATTAAAAGVQAVASQPAATAVSAPIRRAPSAAVAGCIPRLIIYFFHFNSQQEQLLWYPPSPAFLGTPFPTCPTAAS